MATPSEYADKAEELLEQALNMDAEVEERQLTVQRAQVYATLSVAIATARAG